eukprot:CAMPEP_0203665974 /NCGR_PEP_ID=MMETSP0090-20130426/3111_1 /ASSEMBLY_ACC=CAM_ASM_001088 /TAXON_ID=426623 /ORGANISM="Chaetoceros affinis, Strain CCMP159" /LENGTH=940 /DNA_ID=CAMNT_0050529733 /DNA_START=1203 /DNA_END=4022 /DNA_ORIENTATION=-
MVEQNSEVNSSASISSKDAKNVISILAFEGFQNDTVTVKQAKQVPSITPISPKLQDTDNCTLEPATLIYHESARSIVFRDHIRRTHTNSQAMVQSSAANVDKLSISQPSVPPTSVSQIRHNTKEKNRISKKLPSKLSLTLTSHDDESIQTSESDSKKSKSSLFSFNSQKNGKKKKESSSLADSRHSVSSIDASVHNDDSLIVATTNNGQNNEKQPMKPQIIIANYTPKIDPLPALELGPYNEFSELLESRPFEWKEGEGPEEGRVNQKVWDTMTSREQHVVSLFRHQKCVVKTVKKADWTDFLQKFVVKDGKPRRYLHPNDFKTCSKEERYKKYSTKSSEMTFNSFMTSTSLLPSTGMKMRCFGSTKEYCLGVVFALPTEHHNNGEDEDIAAERTRSWCWPSGYAAKTEFNISPYGDLINGRDEALVSISALRTMNHTYLYEEDYEILGRMVKGGLTSLPYNEIYLRVGGCGIDTDESARSFDNGVGLPVGLFSRSIAYGDLIALMRTKARVSSVLGKSQTSNMPLFYITPQYGVHVITETMQAKLLHTMTNSLNPFQNPSLQHKTKIDETSPLHLQQKVQELFDLDDDNIRDILTPEECARLAGGFGATDDSVAHLLMDAMIEDFEKENQKKSTCHLQNLVNEGLTAAVRSGDFNTSRQLLILYTLVASRGQQERERANSTMSHESLSVQGENEFLQAPPSPINDHKKRLAREFSRRSSSVMSEGPMPKAPEKAPSQTSGLIEKTAVPPPPPPPPLDTDKLRSATNSDGLLAVLGAAEVLKSMQNEAAKNRAIEAIEAIEEWIDKSENSVAYRLAHWRDLTAAQGDLKIATESSSHFMAFVSNKAIHNRKKFAEQLRESIKKTNFESINFLKSIHDMVSTMHSPCLRLELLQFILGLDNRYSVAHVARSVELAATCLNISAYEATFARNDEVGESFITN